MEPKEKTKDGEKGITINHTRVESREERIIPTKVEKDICQIYLRDGWNPEMSVNK